MSKLYQNVAFGHKNLDKWRNCNWCYTTSSALYIIAALCSSFHVFSEEHFLNYIKNCSMLFWLLFCWSVSIVWRLGKFDHVRTFEKFHDDNLEGKQGVNNYFLDRKVDLLVVFFHDEWTECGKITQINFSNL